MEPLFDKPMDELREAFVHTRFAEPAMFGRPDIEKWLAESHDSPDHSREPWRASRFLRDFDKFVYNIPGSYIASFPAHLRENATPRSEPAYFFEHQNSLLLEAMHKTLQKGGAELYYGSISGNSEDPLVVAIVEEKALCIGQKKLSENNHVDDNRIEIRSANDAYCILCVLYSEVVEKRPKAQAARTFLSRTYAEIIRRVRTEAERDFDEAVAVSYDGTRIVNAKWVVVVSDSIATLYPGSAFYNRKAKLRSPSSLPRIRYTMMHDDREQIRAFVSDGRYQTIYRFRRPLQDYWVYDCGLLTTGFKLLFIHEDLCPSPLPEGGLEIKV